MNGKHVKQISLVIAKAGLNAVPWVGGSIASLLDDYMSIATERRIQEFMDTLTARVKALEGRIDEVVSNPEEFVELFKSCYLVVVRSHRSEKIQAAARVLSNALLKEGDPEKLRYFEVDHFIRALEGLSIGALLVLGSIVAAARQERERHGSSKPFTINLGHLAEVTNEDNLSLLSGLCHELQSWGLVAIYVPQVNGRDYKIHRLHLTQLGTTFALSVLNQQA